MAGEKTERRRARDMALLAERAWMLAPATAIAGGVLTLAIVLSPGLGFAFHAPRLVPAIETVTALISLVVAYLVIGRYELGGRVSDLALVVAAATLAVTNLAFSTVPAITGDAAAPVVIWSTVWGRALAAAGLAGAALAPDLRLARPRRAGMFVLGGA